MAFEMERRGGDDAKRVAKRGQTRGRLRRARDCPPGAVLFQSAIGSRTRRPARRAGSGRSAAAAPADFSAVKPPPKSAAARKNHRRDRLIRRECSGTHTRHYNTDMRKLTLRCRLRFRARDVARAPAQYAGWTIPDGGQGRKEPAQAVADRRQRRARSLFTTNCQKCHGPLGKGDGPDSPKDEPAADLTDEFRFELNPEGVFYYKIMNGHPPAMPAFKSKLTKDDAWTLVELRQVAEEAAVR